MHTLSRNGLKNINSDKIQFPNERLLALPEKVLQFGTGMLLRGLPDYFIDKANSQGVFNGRVVVVKSTSRGDTLSFTKQDNLYTTIERGLADGNLIENRTINSSISRVLNSNTEWRTILNCALNPDLKIIISNTTEVGLKLDKNDQIRKSPPCSFPGKLLAFLFERYKVLNAKKGSGFVIIPTELLPDNGELLKSAVIELAMIHDLEDKFLSWLDRENYFCNSLVDRIVIGMPSDYENNRMIEEFGFVDELLTVTEIYRLWAIQESSPVVKELLPLWRVDEAVKIEPDIELFRELKMRFLNCTHILLSGISFLSKVETVRDAMKDELIFSYMNTLMYVEINEAFLIEAAKDVRDHYIRDVQDRFSNPYLNHKWKSIAQNYSQKMRIRFLPLLINHYKKNKTVPNLFAFGFASYIMYMKAVKKEENKYYGINESSFYLIDDEMAAVHYSLWKKSKAENVVTAVMRDRSFWNEDLLTLTGFYDAVMYNLHLISNNGMKLALRHILTKQSLPHA